MTAPLPGALTDAENDLRTAQSENDPHRQGQYARSAADSAAEVAVDEGTSEADRGRAMEVMNTALTLAAGSLLRQAQSTLAEARGDTDPQRRGELARLAVSQANQVARHRDITADERAAARQVIGHGRMLDASVRAAGRQRSAECELDGRGVAI